VNDAPESGKEPEPPLEFDPKHVDAFLAKIRADRDRELAAIRRRVQAETTKIRREGHQAARRTARDMLAGVRERERREHDRFLYKVRTELVRERWSVLEDLRGQAQDAVRERFEAAWHDPEQQWVWCRHWIDAARELAGGAPLKIRLGQGVEPVAQKIEQRLESYPGGCSLHADAHGSAGILVSWPDHCLDGTLTPQIDDATDEVMDRLVDLLNPSGAMEENHEPG
jgi:vacuolar-type H+-ATPase subunit E/Vma4